VDSKSIFIIYGDDPRAMALEALERADLLGDLRSGMHVGLKPNMVVAKPASSGATTSAAVVDGVIEFLKTHGVGRISILESSGLGHSTSQAYRVTGLEAVARRQGVELVDLKGHPTEEARAGGFSTRVFRKAFEIDYLINLPVVKAHCQTRITCALKNLKGLIPDDEKRRFHSQGIHRPVALLNRMIRQDLIVADGMQGDLSFEEGGTPVPMDRILVAKDPVLLDAFVAQNLGYTVTDVEHVALAASMGVGSADLSKARIMELNRPHQGPRTVRGGGSFRALTRKVEEREACSVCYGSLLFALERLREEGLLDRLASPVRAGQGFRGEAGPGIGIGLCTSGFAKHLAGCPPRALDIVRFLKEMASESPGKKLSLSGGRR
jgi:uncharacterized protein (DUF362 family)